MVKYYDTTKVGNWAAVLSLSLQNTLLGKLNKKIKVP